MHRLQKKSTCAGQDVLYTEFRDGSTWKGVRVWNLGCLSCPGCHGSLTLQVNQYNLCLIKILPKMKVTSLIAPSTERRRMRGPGRKATNEVSSLKPRSAMLQQQRNTKYDQDRLMTADSRERKWSYCQNINPEWNHMPLPWGFRWWCSRPVSPNMLSDVPWRVPKRCEHRRLHPN